MESQQVLSEEAHLKVLNSRFKSLEYELENVLIDGKNIDKDIEQFKLRGHQMKADIIAKKEQLKLKFDGEFEEYHQQIKLAKEMLGKKEEERKVLLEYLKNSGIYLKPFEDLQNFGWHTLKHIAASNKNIEVAETQKRKAAEFSRLSRIARDKMNTLAEVLNSAKMNQLEANMRQDEFMANLEDWKLRNESQLKQITKMQNDHERLNLLIRQCGSTDEPMSEFIFKNVRAECQSFLNTKCPKELLNGLRKFKTRQERIIKLLKHKDIKLARETNLLRVATDQTADLMQYYEEPK